MSGIPHIQRFAGGSLNFHEAETAEAVEVRFRWTAIINEMLRGANISTEWAWKHLRSE
jgi:hypothetical protein